MSFNMRNLRFTRWLAVLIWPLSLGVSVLSAQPEKVSEPRNRIGRERMRVVLPPRVAPDQQVKPLEQGSRPVIDVSERVAVKVKVVDADTGRKLPHRVHIDDPAGTYFPPDGHFDIVPPRWNSNNVSEEPDTSNDGYDWAMIPEGAFTVSLPARDDIHVRISHGLEYPLATFQLNLAGKAGQTIERRFALKRGINMRERGWMAADTHVHNLTPYGAIRQMPVEAIDYVNLMFIGPTHPLFRRGLLTGEPAVVSTPNHIVYVSQEVRDANFGHMTLMGMQAPIEPIRVYTGRGLVKRQPPLPNEPLNTEVYDRLHAQGGLAYHAHYLFWPGHGSAVGAALGKLDGLEWLRSDIASRGLRTRQRMEIPGFGQRDAGAMWYDMLNCGARIPIIGGTDKMNAGRVVGGTCRTYVKVDDWSHDGFVEGLRKEETFVTNGPLLWLKANGHPIGSRLKFTGEGPVTIHVKAGCFSQRPITHLELIVDGSIARTVRVPAGEKEVELDAEIKFDQSGWLTLRARHEKKDPDNWHQEATAGHTSPIYVTIDGRLPAVEASANYLVARLTETLRWAEEDAIWTSDSSKERAVKTFEQAREFYRAALKRSGAVSNK
jgi:hypothetical protein